MSLFTAIVRGKVTLARMAARTLLQVTGLDGETFNDVELLLPPGYVANPTGGDVLIIRPVGRRRVAICGDSTGDAVSNLLPGEIGLARGGRRVILRQAWTEVVDPAEIRLVSPVVHWSPDGTTFYRLATEDHIHAGVQTGEESTLEPTPVTGALTG